MPRLPRRFSVVGVAIVAAVAAAGLVGAASPTGIAGGSPDLIDVVSLAGTSSAAQAVSIVPVLSTSGGTGTVGAPIALPTAPSGSQNPLTMSGSASSEGSLNLSGNGQYLTVAGYGATPGTASVASTASSSTKRVVGRIDGNGNIDTSTALNVFTGNNARSAVTSDGTHVWITGAGSGDSPKTAVYYASLGGTSGTGIVTPSPTGARDLVIAGGNLYFSTTTTVTPGIYEVGSGLPTSAATATPLVTGASLDPYGFALVQLGAGPGVDTLYVADGTAGGITKYALSGGSWVAKGTAGAGTKLFGLAAKVENGGVQLYATTANVVAGNTVVSFFDSSGAGATISSGSFTTVATAPGGTTYRGVSFAPSGQVLTSAPPAITLADSALSRAIGDSYDPTQTTATISDSVYSANQLTVAASSDNPSVVPSVAVSGAGATRTITVTSNNTVGLANITVTVSTPDGRTASAVLQYGVSAAAPDATSNLLYDFANASTAIDAGGGYYLVGDDEFNQIALYQAGVSGPPVQTWNFDPQMGVADTSQIDIEASARLGNTIYWFGSEGNNSSGAVKPNRAILFATTISGTGAATSLGFAGYYANMRNDLIAWDQANGNQFGFSAGAANGQIPKEVNGFNIEGAEFAAGGSGTLYLGFRAPIVPTSNRTQALVVPVTNLAGLISSSGTVGSATFGTPFFWNLTPAGYVNPLGDTSALGIREIRKNADDQYLIIAGSYEGVPAAPSGGAEYLYTWDGNVAHQPVLTNTVLPTPDDGSWETIVSVPDPLTNGSKITMLEDGGDNDLYNTGVEAKDLTSAESPLLKDRSDVFSVALASQAVAFASTPPSPAYTGTTYTPTVSGGASGSPVTLSIDVSSTPGVCSLAGGQVVLSAPGTCVLDADQAGTFQYQPGHASQTLQAVLPPPPVVTVPADQNVEATGPAGAAVSFTASATDVIDGASSATCAPVSGSTFALGATTVHCRATDSQGVTGTASFTVTVRDTTPPVLTLPTDQYVEATGPGGAHVTFSAAALDAVNGSVPVGCLPGSSSLFALGSTLVHCSATDAHGNTATGVFSVNVLDTTPPSLSLPADQALEATGPGGAEASFDASATDIVDGAVPASCVPDSGSTFSVGATTVNCSATDAHGNSAGGSFEIDVVDTTPPVLTLPAQLTFEATGPDGAAVSFDASATDLVDGAVPVSCSPASGSTFPLGSTHVQCSATDAHGNAATGSFNVAVQDTTPPAITVPGDQVVEATSPAGAPVSYSASANDAVDGVLSPTCAPATGSTFLFGSTTVLCSATDAHGNTGMGSFTVTVADTTPPVLTLPSEIDVEATGPAGATATFYPTATDAIDGPVPVICLPGPDSLFPLGTTTVSCMATDAHGNTSSASFVVRVVDSTPPVLTLPSSKTVEATGPTGAAVAFNAAAADLVDGVDPVTCTPASGSAFALGTTTVHCSAVDAAGNHASGSFGVTVQDTTAPTLQLPSIVVAATGATGAPVTFTGATATDLVDGTDPVTCIPVSGATFPVGVTTVACSASDAHGNHATGSFTVTVQDAPTLHLPADLTIEATRPEGAVVRFAASATDPVDGSDPVSCSPRSGSTFPLGATSVSCSATNSHAAKTTGTFTVTVQDTTPPVLFLPRDRAGEATGPAGRVVRFHASARDAVDGAVPVTCLPDSGSTFPVGATAVQCSATDAHGNRAAGSFVVTVTDTTPPRLSLPDRIAVEATGPSGAEADFTTFASDIVDGSDPVSCSPPSGSTFPIGTTVVHCTSSDAHGNSASGQFTVSVRDTTQPTLHLPANQTAEATGPAGAVVSFTATATDAVDGTEAVSCLPASGSTFRVGVTTVHCSSIDAHGNRATGAFTVTVTDTTAPTLHLPENLTVVATSGAGAVVRYTASAGDLVDGSDPVSCSPRSGSTFPVGTTTVTCSASDDHGNTATGTFSVTVSHR